MTKYDRVWEIMRSSNFLISIRENLRKFKYTSEPSYIWLITLRNRTSWFLVHVDIATSWVTHSRYRLILHYIVLEYLILLGSTDVTKLKNSHRRLPSMANQMQHHKRPAAMLGQEPHPWRNSSAQLVLQQLFLSEEIPASGLTPKAVWETFCVV